MNTTEERRKSPFKPFVMGLALGVLAGAFGMYLGQPAPALCPPSKTETPAPGDCVPVEAKSAEPTVRPGKDPKDFEFYGVLENVPVTPARPDIDQPLAPPPAEGGQAPKAPPAPASASASPAKPVYLQVASFKAETDADALKARIVLAGAPASVVAMEIPEKGLYYRVRLGPFASPQELEKAKAQVDQGGVDLSNAFVVR